MYPSLNDALEATRNRPKSTAELLKEMRRANEEEGDGEEGGGEEEDEEETDETASDSRSSTVMEICDDDE